MSVRLGTQFDVSVPLRPGPAKDLRKEDGGIAVRCLQASDVVTATIKVDVEG